MDNDSLQANADEKICIRMLGQFSITQGNISVNDSSNRTHQLWNLLEYLIAFRKKTISQEELIGALWPDATSENPANALKNLIYRIRTTLQQQKFSSAREMVLFTNGSYRWNNELPCIVDTEEFARLVDLGAREKDEQKHILLNMQALELYQGDLLPGSSYEKWVIGLANYFRAMYFKCVYDTLDLLQKQERYKEIHMLCERAIRIDAFEERVYHYLISALLEQNKRAQALERYNAVTELFYRELGVKPSDSLRALYDKIAGAVNDIETDINRIKEDLAERALDDGAFYCNYEVFRNMYRMEARIASRNGQTVFVALLTLTNLENGQPAVKSLAKAMDVLLECIQAGLRRSDVVSRFSASQYVLMLQTLTFENSQMVIERICRNFRREYRGRDIRLHTALQPLTPAEYAAQPGDTACQIADVQ